MGRFIESVEIYPERQPNGQILKHIEFAFPVYYQGEEMNGLSWDSEGTVETINMWKNGILGVVIGDALGCPVQFESREEVARRPITGMRGFGTFNLPAGTWTDDSSLTLALLESLKRKGAVDLHDFMNNFVAWLVAGSKSRR